jgi:hypothetical protein
MEVGWHLRLSRDDELVFLVQPQLAPNVEDAVFIAGGWELVWDTADEDAGFVTALARRKR